MASALCLAGAVSGARAQYRTQQDGRLFDRNPQIGAGGYNYARPVSPLIGGNALTSGIMGRGLSLRIASPVGDPMTFHGSLGSASLSAFRRDSVSVADVSSPYRGLLGRPYYDPSQTVYNAGFLSGQFQAPVIGPLPMPGGGASSPAGVGGPLDLRLDTRLSTGTNAFAAPSPALAAGIVGLTAGASPELYSTIFGPTALKLDLPELPRVADEKLTDPRRLPAQEYRLLNDRELIDNQRVEDLPGTRPMLGTPEELARSEELSRLPLEPGADPFAPGPVEDAPFVIGPLPVEPGLTEGEAGRMASAQPSRSVHMPRIRDASVLPGHDVFTDMQLTQALVSDPDRTWYTDMQQAIREDPVAAGLLQEYAEMQSQEFVSRMTEAPLQSFRGRGDSALNDELLRAESLLEFGQYYEAVRRYEAAQRIDPLNPLPHIGKGNALLAAGEYLSAAVALVQGFERYPELSQFEFDLGALMGGGEIIDIRRADIMRRLASHDDPRLRFLLGYLEYYCGDQKSGMENLERAAELDRGGSIISRFPTMLRGEGHLPPPKLPELDLLPADSQRKEP